MAHFWPIFPIFGAKKIFVENPSLSHATSYRFLAPCQNLEKVDDVIQRKHPDRWTEGWMEGQKDGRMDRPYFIGPLQLPPGVQKKELNRHVYDFSVDYRVFDTSDIINIHNHLRIQETLYNCLFLLTSYVVPDYHF